VPELLYLLVVLACPVSMGIVMLVMMAGGSRRNDAPEPRPDRDSEIARLRAEVEQLRHERTGATEAPGDRVGG
jgi:hypothetical protein